ncbi:MAG: ctpE [Frankiales bacterium]|nr:ctpE [Frankiales bacterium]
MVEPNGVGRYSVDTATPGTGLNQSEVALRVAAGQTNAVIDRTSRTLAEIVRANVLTLFNALLGGLLLAILATGRWQNGLFGLVIVANSGLGIVQEVRAKRVLDRLAVLNVPTARVVRDGRLASVVLGAVVLDDLLEVRAGDQVSADGLVLTSEDLEIDESLLTGEAEPVPKAPGTLVRSGSIVVAGSGHYQATAVGAEAYATRLAADARRFTLVHSELGAGTNLILRWISLGLLVVGPLLLWSQLRSADNHGWQDAVTGTVAGLVGMVPEGLLLLTSLAFVVATVALARQQVLVQELPAVEGLARVDVVCLDKTGTLTYGDTAFQELIPLGPTPVGEVEQALGLVASSDSANSTAAALARAFPPPTWSAVAAIPFSSARKWSAVETATEGTWVLGAPEMVLPEARDPSEQAARETADGLAERGSRVLLLARTRSGLLRDGPAGSALPPHLQPVALVVLAERVREDAAETLAFFLAQGVSLKVISGDNPRTVGAVARSVGLPGADEPVDARTLPEDLASLADVLEQHTVFGRVSPHQKRAVVATLQSRGHVVAMTGDGVNDALALKDADIGIAMGNGSPATRAVAQIVLLDGQFARLPAVVAEGRRVIANIERAASLFLIKNTYSLVLALITVSTLSAFPLAPIQLTMISTLTIGVPGFFLALAPNTQRYVPGFVKRVLRFAVPIGVVTALAAYAGYRVTRLLDPGPGVAEGRTTATFVILIVSLWSVGVLARPLSRWKLALVSALAGLAAAVAAVPAIGRTAFLLTTTPLDLAVAGVVGIGGVVFVEVTHRAVTALTGGSHPAPPSSDQRAVSGPSTATGQAATRSSAELTEPSA